jgi:hypothetical protein
VEPALWQTCPIQEAMKLMGYNRPVEWMAVGAREHKTQLVPILSSPRPFADLLRVMPLQDRTDCWRHDDGSPAPCSLWFNEVKLSIEALQLTRYAQVAQLGVDILPAQPKSLPLAQSQSQCHRIKRLESIALGRSQKSAGLGGSERLDFIGWNAGPINQCRRISVTLLAASSVTDPAGGATSYTWALCFQPTVAAGLLFVDILASLLSRPELSDRDIALDSVRQFIRSRPPFGVGPPGRNGFTNPGINATAARIDLPIYRGTHFIA